MTVNKITGNSLYSDKVMEHFRNPRNMGEIKNPDGIATVGNPVCGDTMRVYIKIRGKNTSDGGRLKRSGSHDSSEVDGYIADIKFQTLGCAAAIAVSSMLTTMVKGKSLIEAEKITRLQVAKALGGLPLIKMHCSVLIIEALKKAIADYRQNRNIDF